MLKGNSSWSLELEWVTPPTSSSKQGQLQSCVQLLVGCPARFSTSLRAETPVYNINTMVFK